MCEIAIQVNCPYCKGTNVKKNGHKKNGNQNFLCHPCKKQFQFVYTYKGANPRNKQLVRSMTMNGSGIQDIQRVLGLSLVWILFILRNWFKQLDEPIVNGHFKRVQIDEMWTFVKHRKKGKRWLWRQPLLYAYDACSGKILAFHLGKRNDFACKALLKK
jgi:transposase-like protein